MKTLIIGASTNPDRYAYLAAERLLEHGYSIELIGNKNGTVFGQQINTEKIAFAGIDTITLYISKKHQSEYYDYIVSLNPRRVIFNPGTENDDLKEILISHGILAEEACTLVLLGTKQY